jgi:ZIP family zinc transporter
LAGVAGTLFGGVIALFLGNKGKKTISFLLNMAAGVMLAIIFFDLIPEAYEHSGEDIITTLLSVVGGIALIMLLDELTNRLHKKKEKKDSAHAHYKKSKEEESGQADIISTHSHIDQIKDYALHEQQEYKRGMRSTGILIFIAIALHSFPEGIAIGASAHLDMDRSLMLAILIGAHNVPEGIAMAAPLFVSGINKFKVLLYVALAGLPIFLGALLGYFIGDIGEIYVAVCIGMAAGAMVYIVFHEMLPKADEVHRNKYSSLIVILSALAGFALVSFLH